MTVNAPRLRTGEALVQSGVITQEQLDLCLRAQEILSLTARRPPIGEIVLEFGFASRAQVDEAIRRSGNQGGGLANVQLPPSVLRRLKIMPLDIVEGVARIAPLNPPLSDAEMENILNAYRAEGAEVDRVECVARDRTAVNSFLQELSHVDAIKVEEELREFCRDHNDPTLLQQLKNHIFFEALQMRASDLHIERSEDAMFCQISYRVDNVLKRRHVMTVDAMNAFSSAIKHSAHLDSSERHRPLDGQTFIEYHGRKIDLRVSTQPSDGGESMVIRILDPSRTQSIDDIMPYHPTVASWLKSIADVGISKEGSLILMTGPTGMGKSTTLNVVLRAMRRDLLKIFTVEQPVETRVPLVNHVPVNPTAGFGYADALRSLLRQDPNVIVVGEVRDQETALETLKGADTGHMLMATLHTSTAYDAIKRVIALIPEDQKAIALLTLADRLKLVVNQRLVPKLCSCARSVHVHEVARDIDRAFLESIKFAEPTVMARIGCHRCEGSGYLGRALMVEAIWFPSDADTRERMELALRSGNVSELMRIENVQHYTRSMSVGRMLSAGAIDVETARALADFHHVDALEAMQ